ncbi:RIP metalloprotease RseP [Microbaculum marinisediminis]|uniref:Zinc metalloprotease n=1 Tax=Microbaculum marinisediminis TaxID=2931392 RepID=A0AAW5R281_9HYPH|nr:RIP metalloprotease RseP [Microbaculum sp. A6E488]MCT8974370.1 RIP metalloprotease RseP [Microbaculum sp. A6E488]
MGFLDTLGAFGGGAISYVLPFLFVLTIVVFFHELGHFLVARWCGVKIETFSIGFGLEIGGFYDKHGTRWRLSWIPLGGYVKFYGDDSVASSADPEALAAMTEEERRGSFHFKSIGQRAAIVAAGPFANFILAIVIFATVFATVGKFVTPPQVDAIAPDSAAATAGFEPGDTIISISGEPIESFSDMQRIVSVSADVPLEFEVDRGGERVTLTATPDLREVEDRFGNKHRIGLLGIQRSAQPDEIMQVRYSVPGAIWEGTKETWFVIERTVNYLVGIIVGRESADQLSGPIRIAEMSGEVAKLGFLALMNLTAVLSISIGFLNLIPIPMLDGGHLLFYGIEAVRGRPLSERAIDIGFRLGLAMVLMLMLFATWNDIVNIAGRL